MISEKYKRELYVLSAMKPYKNIKIDSYEYDSVADLIINAELGYNSVIDILNDLAFKEYFFKKIGIKIDKNTKRVII